jgi:outer membrane biosynthesis protein TonB
MSLFDRAIPTAVMLALGLSLAACSSNGEFDPTDITNIFNTKKPLPGERRAVFPEGVPGVPQGVPPDLVKGYQPPLEEAQPLPEPVPEKPKKVATKPPPKPKPKTAPPQQQPTAAAPARPAQPAQSAASPWPEPSAQNPWPR